MDNEVKMNTVCISIGAVVFMAITLWIVSLDGCTANFKKDQYHQELHDKGLHEHKPARP